MFDTGMPTLPRGVESCSRSPYSPLGKMTFFYLSKISMAINYDFFLKRVTDYESRKFFGICPSPRIGNGNAR